MCYLYLAVAVEKTWGMILEALTLGFKGVAGVNANHVVRAWGRILLGYTPSLSIEITRECPLRCPGCYAYGDHHVDGLLLRQVRDHMGQDLVEGILRLVETHRPLHLSIVGGEPLVRFRELSVLLPQLSKRGIHVQVVTSAVRPIPKEWRDIAGLRIVVSIDGLQPEHDARRKPATYARIQEHIEGHQITVHCTITRQMTERAGYLREFVQLWSLKPEVQKIWMSLYTPQIGETLYEILPPALRRSVIDELAVLKTEYAKLDLPGALLDGYRTPAENPGRCLFARTTRSVTADLQQGIVPCQFGGNPDCSQCGCFASAGLAALARWSLPIGIRLGTIFEVSARIGQLAAALRRIIHACRRPVMSTTAAEGRRMSHDGGSREPLGAASSRLTILPAEIAETTDSPLG